MKWSGDSAPLHLRKTRDDCVTQTAKPNTTWLVTTKQIDKVCACYEEVPNPLSVCIWSCSLRVRYEVVVCLSVRKPHYVFPRDRFQPGSAVSLPCYLVSKG